MPGSSGGCMRPSCACVCVCVAEPPLPAAAQEEKEAAGVLGRLIKGFFGAAGDKGQAQAQASAQEPRLSSALARNVARGTQAWACPGLCLEEAQQAFVQMPGAGGGVL